LQNNLFVGSGTVVSGGAVTQVSERRRGSAARSI
jgi:hypothetical protein